MSSNGQNNREGEKNIKLKESQPRNFRFTQVTFKHYLAATLFIHDAVGEKENQKNYTNKVIIQTKISQRQL